MKKIIKNFQKHLQSQKLLYIIVLLTFISRFIYQSNYLEDWDSVQFALGLHNYSISNHQPHPPGYPLYILLGKFFYLFFHDDIKSLTFLSSLLGSFIIIPLYLLTKKMLNQITAYIAILLFIFMPLPWLLSEVALTDIPGLFFLISVIYLIYITRNSDRYFLLTCLFSGLVLGFRTNSFLILLGLIFLVISKKRNFKLAILSMSAIIFGTALWLIPSILITGPKQFFDSYSSISNYVISHDVFLGNNLGLKSIMKLKLGQFWYLSQVAYTFWFSVLSFIVLGYLFIKKKLWSDFKYQFLSVWVIAHLIPQFTFYNLEMPRHTLALLPPVIILVSLVIAQLIKKNFFFTILFFLLLAALFSQSWSQVSRLKRLVPPTIQSVEYVKNNFDPKETILITGLTYRQFQYYAPEYTIYYSGRISQIDIPPKKTVIIDYPGLQDKINPSLNFKIINTYEFLGDKDIFPRVPKTNLYILRNQDE